MSEDAARTDPFEISSHFPSVIILDDFYADPDQVRNMALRSDFLQDANSGFPGKRSKLGNLGPSLRADIETILGFPTDRFTHSFQYMDAESSARANIHRDPTDWAGICYLNNDHDDEPGTAIFRHRETGLLDLPLFSRQAVDLAKARGQSLAEFNDWLFREGTDESKWERVFTFPMRYNRMVLYKGSYFHRSESSWGTSPADARLVQAFFMTLPRMNAILGQGLAAQAAP